MLNPPLVYRVSRKKGGLLKNTKEKSCKSCDLQDSVAEREGFEPPVPLGTPVFKTGVIDHSTISPRGWKRVGKYRLVNSGAKVVDLCETTKFCGLFFLFCPTFVGKRVGKRREWNLRVPRNIGSSALRQRLDKRFGAVQGVEFSDIEELEVVGKLASDIKPVAVLQIEVHDREAVWIGTHGFEETRRHDMDAAEGPSLAVGHTQICMGRPYLPCLHIGPSHEALPLAEKQVALGDAVADQQGCVCHRTVVEPGEIGVA